MNIAWDADQFRGKKLKETSNLKGGLNFFVQSPPSFLLVDNTIFKQIKSGEMAPLSNVTCTYLNEGEKGECRSWRPCSVHFLYIKTGGGTKLVIGCHPSILVDILYSTSLTTLTSTFPLRVSVIFDDY
jgi:hypothetical protein